MVAGRGKEGWQTGWMPPLEEPRERRADNEAVGEKLLASRPRVITRETHPPVLSGSPGAAIVDHATRASRRTVITVLPWNFIHSWLVMPSHKNPRR